MPCLLALEAACAHVLIATHLASFLRCVLEALRVKEVVKGRFFFIILQQAHSELFMHFHPMLKVCLEIIWWNTEMRAA